MITRKSNICHPAIFVQSSKTNPVLFVQIRLHPNENTQFQ